MLIFDADTLAIINSLNVETFYLYDVWYDTNQPSLKFTTLSEDFTFNSSVYTSAAVKQSEITRSSDGSVNDVTLSVGNVDGVMQYYYEQYNLSGKPVRIRQLFAGAQSYREYMYIIKSATSNDTQIEIVCGKGFDVFLCQVPRRTVLRNFCKWQFKSSDCAYSGADVVCSKHFTDCRRKGNTANFGGFPAVIANKVYV